MTADKHCVKRAIIMAAGVGIRMQPLTSEIPKPLVEVNGVRMIDSVVSALNKNGIEEIYVVIGYMKERFYAWAAERPDVKLIENPYYDTCNNIASLYFARDYLGDSMILDGDQIIYNARALDVNFTYSGYNALWCEEETDEWLMEEENGFVKSCSRTGGRRGWKLYSVSRWTEEDGARLKQHLEYEFERGNREIYWDDVVMFEHFDEYKLGIWKMEGDDIVEIDSLEELATLDGRYKKYMTDASFG